MNVPEIFIFTDDKGRASIRYKDDFYLIEKMDVEFTFINNVEGRIVITAVGKK